MDHFTVATVIAFVPALVSLAGLAGAWLHDRYGRRVRLKISSEGSIEVEAQTTKQLREVLQIADEYQRKHRKAIIHEP
jgi:hypothetical protein